MAFFISLWEAFYAAEYSLNYLFDGVFIFVWMYLYVLWFVVISLGLAILYVVFSYKPKLYTLLFAPTVRKGITRLYPIIRIFSILLMILLSTHVLGQLVLGFRELRFPINGSKGDKPPVILITIDTLRADALPMFGNNNIETPVLDEFARQSFVYSRAYAQSNWTFPSIASLHTGKYPSALDISVRRRHVPAVQSHEKLSLEHTTLAEVFADYGYHTQAVVTNPWMSKKFQFFQGFDGYYHFEDPTVYLFSSRGGRTLLFRLLKLFAQPVERLAAIGYGVIVNVHVREQPLEAPNILAASKQYVSRRFNSSPFFLWTHLMDPHAPYMVPESYLSDFPQSIEYIEYLSAQGYDWGLRYRFSEEEKQVYKQLYDQEVRFTDNALGEFFAFLKKEHVYDDALIIVASDHGEAFWEHNTHGHGNQFFDEETRVPLFIKLPNQLEQYTIDDPVEIRRIYDFLVAYLEDPDEYICVFNDPCNPPLIEDPFIVSEANVIESDQKMLLSKDLDKFIINIDKNERSLYRIKQDPKENENVIESFPLVAQALEDALVDVVGQFTIANREDDFSFDETLLFGY